MSEVGFDSVIVDLVEDVEAMRVEYAAMDSLSPTTEHSLKMFCERMAPDSLKVISELGVRHVSSIASSVRFARGES